MRALSLIMAMQLFWLPQMVNAQKAVTLVEERGSQSPPIVEEEVKHACNIHGHAFPAMPDRDLVAQFHQYEEMMLDHPLREVPHQPPRS
jgi:hypothetical protein